MFTSVVATCYLLAVLTRWMDKLLPTWGITSLSKSQVSDVAADLLMIKFAGSAAAGLRAWYLLAAFALVIKVGEGGRVVGVHAWVTTVVNSDGHGEILVRQVRTRTPPHRT